MITAPFGLPVVPFQLKSIGCSKDVERWTHGCVTDCSNSVRCDDGRWKWVLGTHFLNLSVGVINILALIQGERVDVRSVNSNTLILFCLDHNWRMVFVSAWRGPMVTIVLRAVSLWATLRTVPSPLGWRKRREMSAWPRLDGFHVSSELKKVHC